MGEQNESFSWRFGNAHPEQTEAFVELAGSLAPEFAAQLSGARDGAGRLVLRATFPSEEQGRAFWLELHTQCLDVNIAMELIELETVDWRPIGEVMEEAESSGPEDSGEADPGVRGMSEAIAVFRPDIPAETLYDILREGDEELEGKLDETIRRIESAGLPVINLLSYLDLPLFTEYAREHEDEREQNLFLHMLHTWTCYRRFGAIRARLTADLLGVLEDARYLRVNTTMFQSPSPALCIQYPGWSCVVRGRTAAETRWVKEVYLTHFEPPTPAEDRELTLMIVTHDERGEFGFIPLEVPLTLPAVDESIEAFFAPGIDDEELGMNTRDLQRVTTVAATYCLYATARDPRRYLE